MFSSTTQWPFLAPLSIASSAIGSCPCPSDTMWYLPLSNVNPIFFPSSSTWAIGFTPGERMKNTPVEADVSLYETHRTGGASPPVYCCAELLADEDRHGVHHTIRAQAAEHAQLLHRSFGFPVAREFFALRDLALAELLPPLGRPFDVLVKVRERLHGGELFDSTPHLVRQEIDGARRWVPQGNVAGSSAPRGR